MRRSRFFICLLLTGLSLFPLAGFSQNSGVNYFRVLAGPPGSASFSLAAKLATIISNPPGTRDCSDGGPCGVPGLIALTQDRKNAAIGLQAVVAGEADAIVAPADQLAQMKKIVPDAPDLKALANLDQVTIHFIALKSAMINDISELKGKKIAIGRENTDEAATSRIVLTALGINPKSKNILSQSVHKSFRELRGNLIDVMVVVDRVGSSALNSMFSHGDLKLLELDEQSLSKLSKLKNFAKIVRLPADLYPGEPSVMAIEIPILWLVRSDVTVEFAYDLTRALQSDAGAFPSFSQEIEPALLHEGAVKFYGEIAHPAAPP